MSKHRRSKKYSGSYDEINEYNDYRYDDQYGNQYNNGEGDSVFNKLSSILGNIDINQITSLLNALGVISNSSGKSAEESDEKNNKKESNNLYDSDINIFELVSQAKAVNDMIMNDNAEIYNDENNQSDNEESNNKYLELKEEENNKRSKHGKKKSRKNEENKKEEEREKISYNNTENMHEEDLKEHSNDPIVALLSAMQSLVMEDKAKIINKILELYIDGKI
ncbi:hypothetical protein Z968_08155 [Clostridium novyi A str. 4552]|uniref:Uncharacterized protein n=1 Tax=Clostridium novyi A str. 4552 TaxID=1444289 RepID=A0A0A0I5I6_CLONO|nr:hypothetical protein [Clostridium novyi]KGM95858.1 hypothetical protein Z968_08155 [Clostridium novyi A str. 4552]